VGNSKNLRKNTISNGTPKKAPEMRDFQQSFCPAAGSEGNPVEVRLRILIQNPTLNFEILR
jgi:hypothetical protein